MCLCVWWSNKGWKWALSNDIYKCREMRSGRLQGKGANKRPKTVLTQIVHFALVRSWRHCVKKAFQWTGGSLFIWLPFAVIEPPKEPEKMTERGHFSHRFFLLFSDAPSAYEVKLGSFSPSSVFLFPPLCGSIDGLRIKLCIRFWKKWDNNRTEMRRKRTILS